MKIVTVWDFGNRATEMLRAEELVFITGDGLPAVREEVIRYLPSLAAKRGLAWRLCRAHIGSASRKWMGDRSPVTTPDMWRAVTTATASYGPRRRRTRRWRSSP